MEVEVPIIFPTKSPLQCDAEHSNGTGNGHFNGHFDCSNGSDAPEEAGSGTEQETADDDSTVEKEAEDDEGTEAKDAESEKIHDAAEPIVELASDIADESEQSKMTPQSVSIEELFGPRDDAAVDYTVEETSDDDAPLSSLRLSDNRSPSQDQDRSDNNEACDDAEDEINVEEEGTCYFDPVEEESMKEAEEDVSRLSKVDKCQPRVATPLPSFARRSLRDNRSKPTTFSNKLESPPEEETSLKRKMDDSGSEDMQNQKRPRRSWLQWSNPLNWWKSEETDGDDIKAITDGTEQSEEKSRSCLLM